MQKSTGLLNAFEASSALSPGLDLLNIVKLLDRRLFLTNEEVSGFEAVSFGQNVSSGTLEKCVHVISRPLYVHGTSIDNFVPYSLLFWFSEDSTSAENEAMMYVA